VDIQLKEIQERLEKKMALEKEGSIHVRQDRFLETGPAKENDNQTIWCIVL
jgi:hypothetical protein